MCSLLMYIEGFGHAGYSEYKYGEQNKANLKTGYIYYFNVVIFGMKTS